MSVDLLSIAGSVELSYSEQRKKERRSTLCTLSDEQKARIGTVVERKKDVLQKNCKISGYKGRIGFRDNTLNRQGRIVESRKVVQKTDAGSEFLVFIADREVEKYDGSISTVTDIDVKIRSVGSDLREFSKKSLMMEVEDTAVCLVCRTSSFVRKVYAEKKRGADVKWLECTCCGSTTKGF